MNASSLQKSLRNHTESMVAYPTRLAAPCCDFVQSARIHLLKKFWHLTVKLN